jgi:SAM-dependent methyltransferase
MMISVAHGWRDCRSSWDRVRLSPTCLAVPAGGIGCGRPTWPTRACRLPAVTCPRLSPSTPDWSRIDLHAIERATTAQARRRTKGIDDIVANYAAHNHDDTHRDVLGPQLREHGPSGSRIITAPYDILGIDSSEHGIEQARANATRRGVTGRFEVADALQLVPHRAYDTVVDSALFHIFDEADRARYVSSLHRVCRPDARVTAPTCGRQDRGEPRQHGAHQLGFVSLGWKWRVDLAAQAYRISISRAPPTTSAADVQSLGRVGRA